MSRLHRAACHCGLLLAAALGASRAHAATIHVTSAFDSGTGTLRSAVDMANGMPGDDDIVFDGDYVITLQSALPPLLAAGGALLPAQTAAFPLTSRFDSCVGITFPYTLTGADNTARVANLRQAVECANANATADVIDLGGNTLSFDDGPYASPGDGVMNALPVVTGGLTLKTGELQRSGTAAEAFRFLYFDPARSSDPQIVDGVTFRNGNAMESAGAILSVDGLLEVRDSRFIGNHASTHGGAIYARNELRLRGSVFQGNVAAFSGGAVQGTLIDSRDTQFESNAAGMSGGGMTARSVVMAGGGFKDNRAAAGGGLSTSMGVVAAGVSFIGNRATRYGGALNLSAGQNHIVNSRFEGNDAGLEGGGAISNDATFGVGIQQCRIVNTLFLGNTTAGQGSIFVTSSFMSGPAEFTNVTASGNGQAGRSLFSVINGSVAVRNSIFWDNPGAVGTATVAHSLVQGGFAGAGNIDGDPRFVDAAGGDYRLGDGSPAIDAGDNSVVPADEFDIDGDGDFTEPTPDFDGRPRLYDDAGVADTGAGVAPLVDMGAYERQIDSVCGTPAFQFPYTLTGTDNAARVANLRQAVECANANATADVIDLGGSTLVFDDAPYADSSGDTALPLVTGGLTLKNGTLQRDAAAPAFRFLTVEPGQSHRVENVTFQGGRASSGGAILTRAALDVRDCLFVDNGAVNVGGAIHAQVELRVRDTSFRRNEAQQGGAVYGDGKVDARGSLFDDNVASGAGGALSAYEVVAWNSRFLRNRAQGGGAIATVAGALSDLLVVRSQFVDNKVPDGMGGVDGFGGAVLYRGTAYVTGSRFTGNEAYSGGALQCLNVATVTCRLDVANSLFAENAAQGGSVHGSQIGDADSQVRFTNVTVADNEGVGFGSGIRLFHNYAGSVSIRNSIVWNNAAPVGDATVDRSLLDVGANGDDNLFDRDPRFVDAANGDYRLGDGSPAVDAGDNGFALADGFDVNENGDVDEDAPDLDNLPRRYDDAGVVDTGVGGARIVDLGAYERQIDSTSPGIAVRPIAGLVTTEAGGAATFAVVLETQPSADVTIPLSSSDVTEGTVSPAALTFTTSNWHVPQTVTVAGVDDAVADGDVAYLVVTAPAVSADANYHGLDAADVSVTNLDDDSAGIAVSPTGGLVTTEAGGTANFTVVLRSEPTADVTIGLSSSDATEGTVSPASVTFTASNWHVPQTVTITGVDDSEVDGDVAYIIVTAPASSGDANYDGLDAADVSVTNLDDDVVAGAHLVAFKSILQPGTTTRPAVYEIVLTNSGAGDQADDPASDELVDVLPPELALRGATASGGVVSVNPSANTVRWNGVLVAGQSVTLRIEADVAITQAATITNQARINHDSDGDGHNDSSSLSTDPAVPGVDVPTAFRFDGAGPPVEPVPVPMDDPVALLGLLLLILLGGGVVISRRGHGTPAD